MTKKKASEALKAGENRGMLAAQIMLGRVVDDCGILEQWEAENGGGLPVPRRASSAAPKEAAKVLQFPLVFGEETRAFSNPFAALPLFAAVQKRDHFKEWVLIGEFNGYTFEFSGEQWNQTDHDTLNQLLKMARHKPYGLEIEVAVNAVLAGLGRRNHQEQRRQLFEQVERLKRSCLRITPKGGRSYVINLMTEVSTPQMQGVLPQHRRALTFVFNERFAPFFDLIRLTLYSHEERLKLGSNDLAKWLHFWIIKNAAQMPHKVRTIRELCGSNTNDLKKFRQQLRRALDILKEAGVITGWSIDPQPESEAGGDLVFIERPPSEAQQKHLAKKSVSRRSRKP